jgi:predicted transcriptional regulator
MFDCIIWLTGIDCHCAMISLAKPPFSNNLTFEIKKTTKESSLFGEGIGMQLTIRMPDEYREKIEILAEKMGLKKSDVARLALKQFIEENMDNEQRRPYEKVKHLLGAAESGMKDLGQRHRDHLIQKIRKGS